MGEHQENVSMPEHVVAFAHKMHLEQGGPQVIRFDVIREDDDVGYLRTGDCGECLFDPEKDYYLNWVKGIHENFTSKGMFVEWNVFQKKLTYEQYEALAMSSHEIEKSFN